MYRSRRHGYPNVFWLHALSPKAPPVRLWSCNNRLVMVSIRFWRSHFPISAFQVLRHGRWLCRCTRLIDDDLVVAKRCIAIWSWSSLPFAKAKEQSQKGEHDACSRDATNSDSGDLRFGKHRLRSCRGCRSVGC